MDIGLYAILIFGGGFLLYFYIMTVKLLYFKTMSMKELKSLSGNKIKGFNDKITLEDLEALAKYLNNLTEKKKKESDVNRGYS